MGFSIFGKSKELSPPTTDSKSNVSVALTDIGRKKAEQMTLVGPKFDVIAT